MSATQILLKNPKTTQLSVDAKISEDLVIRRLLAPAGDVDGRDQYDVAAIATLDDLNRSPQIRALLDNQTNGVADPLVTIELVGGTNNVAGSDSATAVPSAEGLGGVETLVVASDPATGTDHTLIAAMPYTALVIDAQLMVDTTEATTWTLRDALAGGGNALSDDLSTAAAARVRDGGTDLAGVVATIAKGDPLVLNKGAVASATGYVMVTFQRLS